MKINTSNLSINWKKIIEREKEKPYFKNIEEKLNMDLESWINIYPPLEKIFNAFEKTTLENLKVVIIWQDPYHQKWQAQGFCFSVPKWFKLPPSLKNIYKELNNSLWIDNWTNWDLTAWTKQWVFLLNASLTVQESNPMSHAKIWWETFTDNIIKHISNEKNGVIFLLWWWFAKSKKKLIDTEKHYILETSHPSPLWAYRWFLWSDCFKEVNNILKNIWKKEINWLIKK